MAALETSGLTRYCPRCYERNPWSANACLRCGASLDTDETFDERLCWALDHPEPGTALRAAGALGQRRHGPAVPALARVALESRDPYLAREAALALLEFPDDPRARAAVRRLAGHRSFLVRQAVRPAAESRVGVRAGTSSGVDEEESTRGFPQHPVRRV